MTDMPIARFEGMQNDFFGGAGWSGSKNPVLPVSIPMAPSKLAYLNKNKNKNNCGALCLTFYRPVAARVSLFDL
jgi:hypothetical protein